MQPFPHPNDATHKIWSRLANWLQRYSSSKVWNFRHSRASNSKMSGLIQPKIELIGAFMPVLVTSNFDDDSIKNERASMETSFSYYKSMGNFLDAQGHSQWSNSSEILCMSALPANIKRIRSKTTEKRWRHPFPHYNSSQPLCLSWLPATLMMSQLKMNELAWRHHFPIISLWDIQVWKGWRRRTTTDDGRTTDHWYTISSPCEPLAQVS